MENPKVIAHSLARTAVITVPASRQEAFALFGPIKEKEWADGWQPQIIYATTDQVFNGLMEEHMIFRTPAAHGPAEGEYTWVVSKYQPEQALVEYTVFTAERLWWITIQCRADSLDGEPNTHAEITYTYVGLTEHGQEMNGRALERMFAHNLKDWETAIRHYLKTGERLS
jgi:hypothetical protein